MDTSEQYIKMCDCPEVQGQEPDASGEYMGCRSGDESGKSGFVWLPQQDQIQEMLPESNCKCPCCLIVHLNKFVTDNINGFADRGIDTMEQYWLAFYMSEKHSKIWGKEGWTNNIGRKE